MRLEEILSGIAVLENGADPDLEITSISSDSRKMEKGSAFVCLKGLKVDGSVWIPSAVEKGAVVAICSQKPAFEVPYVVVEDPRAALPLMLSNFYSHPEKSFQRMIGITGTNGKTSTSMMLKAIFDAAGHKTGLIGTTKYLVGNEEYPVDPSAAFLTTPDPELLYSLFTVMRAAGVDTVIMEASSHALALQKLNGITFDIAIFTNLTQDHLDFHQTPEEYAKAKKKLFYAAKVGILNMDDPWFARMSSEIPARVVSYSARSEKADYYREETLSSDDKGICYLLKAPEYREEVTLSIPGNFTVYNSLAAVAAATECGIPFAVIDRGLRSLAGVAGRIERIPTDTPYSVFIDFAHTPDAMENILTTLRGFTRGRLLVLFGCGGDRDRTKRPLMGKIACRLGDLAIITSDNCRSEKREDIIRDILVGVTEEGYQNYVTVTDRAEAIRFALREAREGDVILLAGKGHEEYEIDENGKHSFSERNIVMETIGVKES
ncbi:MAG: UDP-N-acetylmuramoyl-L-alanyl-D-glutamate--2,6-diaminopimelate ligase [Clostridia bacterium]|nr:UDP-N-acetylmuramoyl-L-alanyl-D-glutamate--2,6-diaminopimelate ligase [Clostridia bacterium]